MNTNYINTTETLQLFIYDNGSRVSADATPTIAAVDSDSGGAVTMSSVVAQNHVDGYDYYEAFIDPSEVTYRRNIEVTWTYVYNTVTYTKIDIIEVVQPYFDADDLWSFNPEYAEGGALPQTLDDVKRIETLVRGLIDTYCRQQFQPFGRESRAYFGNGSNVLELPDRIYKLYKVDKADLTLFEIDGGDNVLTEIVTWDQRAPDIIRKTAESNAPFLDVRADISPGLLSARKIFKTGVQYNVEADYGWKNVPRAVQQAALILASDHIEENDIYHQQNITTVRSADFRMEWGADHHTTTGNTHADHLLTNYTKWRLSLI